MARGVVPEPGNATAVAFVSDFATLYNARRSSNVCVNSIIIAGVLRVDTLYYVLCAHAIAQRS